MAIKRKQEYEKSPYKEVGVPRSELWKSSRKEPKLKWFTATDFRQITKRKNKGKKCLYCRNKRVVIESNYHMSSCPRCNV